jgi:hypothetical protein
MNTSKRVKVNRLLYVGSIPPLLKSNQPALIVFDPEHLKSREFCDRIYSPSAWINPNGHKTIAMREHFSGDRLKARSTD